MRGSISPVFPCRQQWMMLSSQSGFGTDSVHLRLRFLTTRQKKGNGTSGSKQHRRQRWFLERAAHRLIHGRLPLNRWENLGAIPAHKRIFLRFRPGDNHILREMSKRRFVLMLNTDIRISLCPKNVTTRYRDWEPNRITGDYQQQQLTMHIGAYTEAICDK